jgi:hypothetical protein
MTDEMEQKDRSSRDELTHLRSTIVSLREKLEVSHAK